MKAYEELVGSTGSRIHYRAERHDPHILFRQSEPVVDMGGRRVRLRDFSLSGVTVTLPRGEGPDATLGSETFIELELQGRCFYRGAGRILDVSACPLETTVEILLTAGYLDIAQLEIGRASGSERVCQYV